MSAVPFVRSLCVLCFLTADVISVHSCPSVVRNQRAEVINQTLKSGLEQNQFPDAGRARSPDRANHLSQNWAAVCGLIPGKRNAAAQSIELAYREARNELASTSHGYLHATRHQRGVVANGGQRPHADHRGSCSRIQGKLENYAARRTEQFGTNKHQTRTRIKSAAHSTIAASSGIRPV